MEVIILDDAAAVCTRAARLIAALVRRKPAAVLGLATGETPKRMYAELVRLHEEGLDLGAVTTFNLDEFVGVSPEHPASYHRYMHEHLFDHLEPPPPRVHVPSAAAAGDDVPALCERYEAAIRAAGGIDLQVLGLGAEGHIGFNEPTSSLGSRTRIKTLARETIEAARAAWAPQEPPRHVITMGVATILEARRCVLLATGSGKARAVARMVEGPLTSMVPASALQLHPHATVLIDQAAAAELTLADYYREVWRDKPAWQRQEDGD